MFNVGMNGGTRHLVGVLRQSIRIGDARLLVCAGRRTCETAEIGRHAYYSSDAAAGGGGNVASSSSSEKQKQESSSASASSAADTSTTTPLTSKMSTFEKLSWVACASGLALIVGLKVYSGEWSIGPRKKTEAELEAEREAETQRRESIRYMLAGGTFEKGDAFDGLSPEEIERFAAEAKEELGIADGEDPFEDMSPAEIDAYMSRTSAGAQAEKSSAP